MADKAVKNQWKKDKKFGYLEAEIEVNEDWKLKTCILSHAESESPLKTSWFSLKKDWNTADLMEDFSK